MWCVCVCVVGRKEERTDHCRLQVGIGRFVGVCDEGPGLGNKDRYECVGKFPFEEAKTTENVPGMWAIFNCRRERRILGSEFFLIEGRETIPRVVASSL